MSFGLERPAIRPRAVTQAAGHGESSRIRATFELDREMKALREQGWLVFGGRARGSLRGGTSRGDSDWDTAYLLLVRTGSPDIVRVDVASDSNGHGEASK